MARGQALAILAVAFVAGVGCQSPAAVGLTATDEAAVREALDIEMKSANAADAAAWASIYTEDAIVLRPHANSLEGREAIQKWLGTLPPISNAKGEVREVFGYGDLAYSRGSYSMTFTIPGVPRPIEEQGKFVQIFRKQSDGSWKMAREIYNSDLPLPTPPPPQSADSRP